MNMMFKKPINAYPQPFDGRGCGRGCGRGRNIIQSADADASWIQDSTHITFSNNLLLPFKKLWALIRHNASLHCDATLGYNPTLRHNAIARSGGNAN